MNFYPHYLGDYDRDTKGLNLLQHGAYRRLIDHCYATEEMPPNDIKECYRIVVAMTPAEREAVDKVVDKFFKVNGDGRRHHKRIEEELVRMRGKSEKAKASAEARWGKSDPQPEAPASLMRTHSAGDANQNQKPEKSKDSPASQGRGATASQPLDCPVEKLISLYHEALPNCTRMEKLTPARRALIRARWIDESKPNREKHPGYSAVEAGLAYWGRFFAWCSQSEFLTGRAAGRNGGAPFVASLPWLLKSENFAKAIEGTYHRS